jgi:DNA-binding XRE family transcriptional regulator
VILGLDPHHPKRLSGRGEASRAGYSFEEGAQVLLGSAFRRSRVDNLAQEALAEKVGISVRYTQSIEAGEYWPALPTLLKLRKVLAASWEDIRRPGHASWPSSRILIDWPRALAQRKG